MEKTEVTRVKTFKFVLRQKKQTNLQPNQKLHWTKFDKPIGEMTQDERRSLAEKIVMGSLESLVSKKKEDD